MKHAIIGVVALLIIGIGAFFLLSDRAVAPTPEEVPEVMDETPMPVEPDGGIGDGAEPLPERMPVEPVGQSVSGATISAHHFGTGEKEVLVIGGTHAGFAPNTVAVAEELIAALNSGSMTVPDGVTLTVIPNINPDATRSPNTLAGRLNENGVDLNRNFDCEWQPQGTWNSTPVSGGSAVFSEPEARAVRDYVESQNPVAVVVFYAADGGVYASNCGGALNPTIATLTGLYADASGYTGNEEFDAYALSGDMTNWMAKIGVPAIGVLLSDYTTTEFSKNQAGIAAVLDFVAQE